MQAEQQSERERFEAWHGGLYRGHQEEIAYAAWQARAALSHPSPQWLPIETCPIDTMVIFGPTKRMTGPCIGMHHSRDGWVTETPSDWASIYPPKEWMPLDLPPPPEQGSKG